MAKRKDTTTSDQTIQGSITTATDPVEQRLVAFAEQLGRIVGTVQAKAEGWLGPPNAHGGAHTNPRWGGRSVKPRRERNRVGFGRRDPSANADEGAHASTGSDGNNGVASDWCHRPERREGRCAG